MGKWFNGKKNLNQGKAKFNKKEKENKLEQGAPKPFKDVKF